MIYSKSCEYAVRALIYLAQQPEGVYRTIQQISRDQQIPGHFLGKLLQHLAKYGFVTSQKGRSGGFALAMPADEISLLKVVEYIDGLNALNRCVIGLGKCGDDVPCPAHESWVPVKEAIMEFLEKQTIGSLAQVELSS